MPDANATSPAWVATLSALGGVIVGLYGPWLTSTATAKRERETRSEARRDAAREKQNSFQRETLIGLQEAAEALALMADRIYLFNSQTGNRSVANYTPALAAESSAKFILVAKLRVRVTDEMIRHICAELITRYNSFLESADPQTNDADTSAMFGIYERLNNAIGERLRTLNDEALF